MEHYGLIGKNLQHSWSEKYFTKKFAEKNIRAQYQLFPIESIDFLPGLLERHTGLKGLNVTLPYKKLVIPFLHSIDKEAKLSGSVNTIKIIRTVQEVSLIGYNTDIIGFTNLLKANLTLKNVSALVLGTGGVSRSVQYVLRREGIRFVTVSRSSKKNDQLSYENLLRRDIQSNLLIINTTPVGMFPKTDEAPAIPYSYLTPDHLLIDLIYNPEETLFMKKGAERGARVVNGLQMLHDQADAAWNIWKK